MDAKHKMMYARAARSQSRGEAACRAVFANTCWDGPGAHGWLVTWGSCKTRARQAWGQGKGRQGKVWRGKCGPADAAQTQEVGM